MYLTQEQANNKDLIRYLAEQAIPENIQSIVRLKGGNTSSTYEINDHLIFKIPEFRTPLEKWNEQSQCAPIIQKYLPVQIPQPKLKKVFLSTSATIPLLTSSYEKIDGYTISHSKEFFQKEATFKQKYFEQLAAITHQLHTIDPKVLPVPISTVSVFLQNMFSRKIGGITPMQQRLFSRMVRSSCLAADLNSEKTVLCHCDLRPANVCLDKKNNIVGILDFDSLNRGKSFMEFRPHLYGAYGKEADTKQFFHTYYQQNNYPEPLEQFKDMRRTLIPYYIMGILFKYQNSLTRKLKKIVFRSNNSQRIGL